jgi:bifunctional DNA-binding transcriptional regulator/antitoxin component of YhaV-PrlF toxin-antitoxin module
MASSGDLKVSSRGQMSLPAATRRRWRLGKGGEVGHVDLGEAVIIVPGGVETLRKELLAAVTEADWRAAADGFGDPEFADQ